MHSLILFGRSPYPAYSYSPLLLKRVQLTGGHLEIVTLSLEYTLEFIRRCVISEKFTLLEAT